MPFTFAHPSIVLPLNYVKKKWFSLTGLILGSITPDFEYFIKMEGEREFGHTWAGLFWFNLPLALLLAFLIHNIIKVPLIDHLPKFLKGRLFRYTSFNWNQHFKKYWLVVCISILIGSLSHFFLDSFTNKNGFFVDRLSFYSKFIILPFGPKHIRVLFMNGIVSYFLSFIGCCIGIYSIWQLPVEKNIKTNDSFLYYWIVIGQLTLIIALLRLKQIISFEMKVYWYLNFPIFMIITISAFMIAVTFTSFVFRYRLRR